MKVTREAEDDLRTYTLEQIAERTNQSERQVRRDADNPASPLKWTHKAGKKKAIGSRELRAYIEWLRIDRQDLQAQAS